MKVGRRQAGGKQTTSRGQEGKGELEERHNNGTLPKPTEDCRRHERSDDESSQSYTRPSNASANFSHKERFPNWEPTVRN
jgi:hypothetical protein